MKSNFFFNFREIFDDVTSKFIKVKSSQYKKNGPTPIIDQGKKLISGYTDQKFDLKELKPPFIIFGDHTRCIKFATTNFAIGADGTKVLKPKVDADHKFLYHFLKSIKIVNAGYSRHFKFLKRSKIFLPALEEQKRISKIFGKPEKMIEIRKLAINKLSQLELSLFSNIIEINDNIIDEKKLGDIYDVRDGTHDSPKYINIGFPLVTSTHLKINKSSANLISKNDFDKINKRSKVDNGDILMPMIGTIGYPVIVNETNPLFAIKNVALIKKKKNSPSNLYAKAVLESDLFIRYINKLKKGGNQKFLSLGDLRNFNMPIIEEKKHDQFILSIKKINVLRKNYFKNLNLQKKLVSSYQYQFFNQVND